MIVVETPGALSGAENMDADVRSAMDCVHGRREPHLRLYTWNPAAISLGAHQDPSLIDRTKARLHGVDVVQRPTGGGAILHTDELTYCITLPLGGQSPTDVYGQITNALLRGLTALGIAADAETWPTAASPDGYSMEPLCFSGIARHEIRVGGRKLVGSAQRLYRSADQGHVVLQHGSILLSDAHTMLPVYMSERVFGMTTQKVAELKDRSTSLEALMRSRPDMTAVIDAIRFGFEQTSALWNERTAVHMDHRQEVDT